MNDSKYFLCIIEFWHAVYSVIRVSAVLGAV